MNIIHILWCINIVEYHHITKILTMKRIRNVETVSLSKIRSSFFTFYVKQCMFKDRPRGNVFKIIIVFKNFPKFLHFQYLRRKNPTILLKGQDMSLIESGPLDYKAVLWYLFTFGKQWRWGGYCCEKNYTENILLQVPEDRTTSSGSPRTRNNLREKKSCALFFPLI